MLARTATQTSWRCCRRAVVAGVLGPQAPHLGQGAVEGPHDVGHRMASAGRASRYPPSAPRWLATMPARRRSLRIDTEELGRQGLGRGQRLGRGRLPPLRQREQGTHPVVDLGRDVHTPILPGPDGGVRFCQ